MQSSHKTNLQGHSNVSSNNWMARPTQQHWPLASPAQLQLWVSPFRPAAATSISAFDDITRKERIRRKTMQSNPLTKLIFKATPTSRQTIGWLDPPNNTGLWLLLRNFRFGFLHFVLPQPHPFLLLMILQGRKESEERQCNPLTKLIFKATPTSRQTIGWLDPPNNTGLWLLLRNFRFGFLHFVLPQPDPFLLLMILQAITVYNSCLGLGKHSGT